MGEVEDMVIGKREMAGLLDVKVDTPKKWALRGLLPKPDHPPVNGGDAWRRSTIERWARATGRWPAGKEMG